MLGNNYQLLQLQYELLRLFVGITQGLSKNGALATFFRPRARSAQKQQGEGLEAEKCTELGAAA